MKLISRIALLIARHIPQGYWRLIRFAAKNDPALWDFPIQHRFCRHNKLRANLREPVYTQLYRQGCFPHQTGEDLLCIRLLRSGDRVFDIGANIGYLTLPPWAMDRIGDLALPDA